MSDDKISFSKEVAETLSIESAIILQKTKENKKISKFEGSVPAVAVEPGVPILTLAPGETSAEGFHRAHEEHLDHTFGDHFKDDHGDKKGDH